MPKAIGVLQARMSSTRLPGKVLLPILGRPMLTRQIQRLRRCKRMDLLVVATSTEGIDRDIEGLCKAEGVAYYRGALDDVLDRFYHAALPYEPKTVVRLTGDCPLTDPALIDRMITAFSERDVDYLTNAIEPTFPDGLDAEVMRFSCLETAWREARLPSEREHVTQFISNHPERFRIGHYKESPDLSHLRWTVDESADYELVTRIYKALFPANEAFTTQDILQWLAANPRWKTHNTAHQRNEGLAKSLTADADVQIPSP
ncbi:MAG TPA: glycosyltransferase family protein [Rhodocyclaceae bacterium]|nr:glycosyltransferase family protein [Rhodocyclaceae bacterium]